MSSAEATLKDQLSTAIAQRDKLRSGIEHLIEEYAALRMIDERCGMEPRNSLTIERLRTLLSEMDR